MVWSQYVYEATTGLDVVSSDDDSQEPTEKRLLSIHDFQDEYSQDLWYLWDILQELLYDAFLHTKSDFNDLVELCYTYEDEPVDDDEQSTEFQDMCKYMWMVLNRNDTEGLLADVTYTRFCRFLNLEDGNFNPR
jgi:hypothetical protein